MKIIFKNRDFPVVCHVFKVFTLESANKRQTSGKTRQDHVLLPFCI